MSAFPCKLVFVLGRLFFCLANDRVPRFDSTCACTSWPITAFEQATSRRYCVTKIKEFFSSDNHAIRRALLIGVAFVLGFIVLFTVSIQVWEYSNSPAFCTNICHNVHPEERIAYQDSYHANVGCTECHLSRGGMLENLPLKAGHLRHVPETLLASTAAPGSGERCVRPVNPVSVATGPPLFRVTWYGRSGVFGRTKTTPKSAPT